MAVMASGFNGQQFSFHGYLPVKPPERRAALKRLEAEVRRTGSTQLCIETPHRNAALLEDCLAALAPSTHLCIAYNLGSPQQWVRTQSLGEWRNKLPNWAKEPALFGLGVPQG
jgi:16S rRNA (cytidine1402-2'-O)-methyltransferase